MSPLLQAGHARRMALLAALPLGDLADRTCVDCGVDGWGFGATFPALQRCGRPIALDLAASGDRLPLPDAGADVFFAGECIEHVENVELFLDEIHRVLRPDGLLVLTALNADAYLYRMQGDRYGTHGTRRSLMGWRELRRHVAPRFDLLTAHGFNASVHPDWDHRVTDDAFVAGWAGQCADRPDLATSVVLLARRRADHRPARYRRQAVRHDAAAVRYQGAWHVATLDGTTTGRLTRDGAAAALALECDGTDLLVFLWSHPWSGHAFLEVDGVTRAFVNLFDVQPGWRRVHVGGLAPGRHRLRIRGSAHRDPRSQGAEVTFCQVIAYTRLDEEGRPMPSTGTPGDTDGAAQPGRFGVVLTAPSAMTAPARALLYSLVLGRRPRRCLDVGARRGGSALIIGAALDDVGEGTLVCVDPHPMVAANHWAGIAHRATMIAGAAPEALARARDAAGGPFDLALVEGGLDHAGVVRDVEAVLGVAAPRAYVLVHDASQPEVARAVDDLACRHADRLVDCGLLAEDLRLLRHHGGA
jgi:predicted O-methyltransferase YrrM/SAM-dependent methyltransferase